jgi:hypothetical protein
LLFTLLYRGGVTVGFGWNRSKRVEL